MSASEAPRASAIPVPQAPDPHSLAGGVLSGGAASARAALDPRWGLVAIVLAVAATFWFLFSLARDIDAADFTHLDLDAVRVDSGPGWVDPRWETWVEQRVRELPAMNADDAASPDALRGALEELPFVAEVSEVRVLWPDGVRAELRWREPAACVRTGDGFAVVSVEGVVLPGEWSAPPPRRFGHLPMLAGAAAERGELESGAWLSSPCWEDGLSVARALATTLAADDWIRLGRIVIDAREGREASVEKPGVVLWLEGGRRAYFGRSPNRNEPGELPVERKCASLSRALRLLDDGPTSLDWELADLRWDQPELLPRGGLLLPETGAAPASGAPQSSSPKAPMPPLDTPRNTTPPKSPSGVR
jgi:hypothetical protein